VVFDVGYEQGAPWDGKPRWICKDPLCGFDSLREDEMIVHVEEFHMLKPSKIIDSGLVDEKGNPITMEKLEA
jgi:hypothetical protein